MKRTFGLIGYNLSHSFSKKFFSEKFKKEGIDDAHYEMFELSDISELKKVITTQPHLKGLNVTIPYKQQVMPYLDTLDNSAEKVGAVNTIVFTNNAKKGFNTDYYGFKGSLENWIPDLNKLSKALILGTGGASRAVKAVLEDLNIPYLLVSRTAGPDAVTYEELERNHHLGSYPLIINTTPAGMAPNTGDAPPLQYKQIDQNNYCYDLIYNPEETRFMQLAKEQGAATKNGLEMLYLQAEKSWEIWNNN